MSQMRTLPSVDPDTTWRPSGVMATVVTSLECPWNSRDPNSQCLKVVPSTVAKLKSASCNSHCSNVVPRRSQKDRSACRRLHFSMRRPTILESSSEYPLHAISAIALDATAAAVLAYCKISRKMPPQTRARLVASPLLMSPNQRTTPNSSREKKF